MSRDAVEPWGALRLTVPSALADEVCGALAWDSMGAQLEGNPTTAGQQGLCVYVREPDAAEQALEQARRVLGDFGLDPAGCELQFNPVADGRWVERYQELLRPFCIGAGYRIYPSGVIDEPAADRLQIRLIPGRAFGTGEHATTQLCTERLEQLVRPGSRWLDVGCGTAILSIVARHRGARAVLALDLDPQAIEVAAEVLAANDTGDGIELAVGEVGLAPEQAFEGVVVNISAPFFDRASTALARRLVPGGVLVASGFTLEQRGDVGDALSRAGLELDEASYQRGVWTALVARREG